MGSEKRKATKSVMFRVTPEDHARLMKVCESQGLGPSSFARIVVCKAAGLPAPNVRRKPDSLARDIAKALGEIGRMGNNVNQIAKVANTNGDLASMEAAEAIRAELGKLTQAFLDLRK